MITTPWLVRDKTATEPVLVMTSRFEVKSTTNVPRFMFLALRAYFQALGAPGVVGVSLRAAPLKRSFWTLSSWQDEKQLREYSLSQPHRNIMRVLGPVTETARFVFFTAPASPVPTWPDALQRLAAADAGQGEAEGGPGNDAGEPAGQ
jgi:hypothetical protein